MQEIFMLKSRKTRSKIFSNLIKKIKSKLKAFNVEKTLTKKFLKKFSNNFVEGVVEEFEVEKEFNVKAVDEVIKVVHDSLGGILTQEFLVLVVERVKVLPELNSREKLRANLIQFVSTSLHRIENKN